MRIPLPNKFGSLLRMIIMKPPCIRGLKRFEDGCPQRSWNGEDGCQAWTQDWITVKGEREIREACIDWWIKTYLRFSLSLLEGNQQASEGTRNMTGLLSMVVTRQAPPEELIRVATKHINDSRIKLEEIEDKNEQIEIRNAED